MPELASSGSPETASASASTTATPSSTSDIAASVIADMDADNGSDSAPARAASSATSAETKPDTQPDIDPDDFDAVPAEITDSLNRKRVNSIPHPRVKTMLEKREKKLIATVAKELGITKAEAELQLDDVLGGVRERSTKLTDYESQLRNITAAEQLMVSDPDRFMEMLSTLNPGYKAYQKAVAAAAAQATPQGDDDPEPEPDYDLGNGQKTYSLDGLRKLRAWERRQVVKELGGSLEQRIKPFEQERQQQAEREAAQRQLMERQTQLQKRVDRARKWPQFTEHEKDIVTLMDQERSRGNFLSFEDAYMHVVMPKLAGDRTKIRQEVLAEINGQPRSTSVTPTAAPRETERPKTTAEIAREVMASLTT